VNTSWSGSTVASYCCFLMIYQLVFLIYCLYRDRKPMLTLWMGAIHSQSVSIFCSCWWLMQWVTLFNFLLRNRDAGFEWPVLGINFRIFVAWIKTSRVTSLAGLLQHCMQRLINTSVSCPYYSNIGIILEIPPNKVHQNNVILDGCQANTDLKWERNTSNFHAILTWPFSSLSYTVDSPSWVYNYEYNVWKRIL